jgi:crotonobetainyl-CoA:carnitine CoA-transferase CaiB-like acyl-CoA transferase
VSDVAASYMAFGMINAALVHRFRTGAGQQLDVSLLASSLGLLPDPVAIYFDTGERPVRAGNRNVHLTPAEAFQTKDGLLNVVLMNPDQWGRFCGALGDPAMETDTRFHSNDARLAHHAAFKARVEHTLATAATAEWVTRLEQAGIAAGPVYEFHEVFEDPQVRELELVATMDQPGAGRLRILGFPGRASGTPPRIERPAPLLGQHTAEVLEELGLSRDEIDKLAASGVVALGDGIS